MPRKYSAAFTSCPAGGHIAGPKEIICGRGGTLESLSKHEVGRQRERHLKMQCPVSAIISQISPSHYACKMCSSCPGINLEPALQR